MSQVEEMEMTEQFRMWIDECSKACGGINFLSLLSFLFQHPGKQDLIFVVWISCIVRKQENIGFLNSMFDFFLFYFFNLSSFFFAFSFSCLF